MKTTSAAELPFVILVVCAVVSIAVCFYVTIERGLVSVLPMIGEEIILDAYESS